ncbi:MAG: substrate-binding domain-containing protein [Lachnospiraceae bacterium]
MKKFLSLMFICIFCINAVTGCSSQGKGGGGGNIRIFLTVSQADTFRTSLIEAAKKEAENIGAEFVTEDAGGVLETQVAQIKNAVKEGYDVILCNPINTDTALELEEIAGDIPIVFFNSCPDDKRLKSDKYIYVGSSEADAGRYQAEYILENSQGKDEINLVIMQGELGHSATKGRTDSLLQVLKESGKTINVVFKDTANWDQAQAKELFNIFLSTGQPYDFVASNNDSMALGVLDAYALNNINPQDVPVLGVDATADGCASIENGQMAFTVYQPAKGQGEYVIKAAAELAKGGSISGIEGATKDNKYVYVPFEKVTSSNVSQYR